MSDTIELTIDGKVVQATPDMTILKAAASVGVKIPTLCYDPRLQPFGACRMCLVEVEQMKGRLIPACSTPVGKDMIIHTNTEDVRKARRMLMELLMIHHPLDCPVCDKAGECKLQDTLFDEGVSENRMMYGQVKFHDTVENRSHLIERDTNRCILCGLCVRVCDEVQSVGEINFVGRGFPTQVGTCFDKQLDCEFCGQCISICPVGALNSKVFKHKVRTWDLEATKSTCAFCGVGCSIEVDTRNDRIYRVKTEIGMGINEGNLCGKGRFGWEYTHDEQRLTAPLVREGGKLVKTTWDKAIAKVADGLKAAVKKDGAEAVAGLASTRLTNEEAFLFAKLMKETLGVPSVDSAASSYIGPLVKQAQKQLGVASSTTTFKDINKAGALLVVNSSTQEANPVIGNRIIHRRRYEETAYLATIHPRRMKIARFADQWLPAVPEAAADILMAMCNVVVGKELVEEGADGTKGFADFKAGLEDYAADKVAAKWGVDAEAIQKTATRFAKGGPGMIILGAVPFADKLNTRTAAAAINLLLLTGNIGKEGAGLLIMAEKNNMQGLLDVGCTPGEGGSSAGEIIKSLDGGRLRALYLVGENVLTNFPGGKDRSAALDDLDFLVVNELFPTEIVAKAHVVLPVASAYEKGGTFTNSERRVQKVNGAVKAPGQARTDGEIFLELAQALDAEWGYENPAAALTDLLAQAYPGVEAKTLEMRGVLSQTNLAEGLPQAAAGYQLPEVTQTPAKAEGYPINFEFGPSLFHSGTLSVRSPQLLAVLPEAVVHISRQDASELGIAEGDTVNVASSEVTLCALAKVSADVTKGNAFMPFHFTEAPALSLSGSGQGVRVKIGK